MPFKITKKVDNFRQYIDRAPDAALQLEEEHTKAWADVMRQIEPEKTGKMKRETKAIRWGKGWAVIIGVFYFRFVNDGTIHQDAQHFIELSREFVRKAFLRDLGRFTALVKKAK